MTFAGGAPVVVNRGANDWRTDGAVSPRYGFVARAGTASADITRRDGQVSAMARNGKLLFLRMRCRPRRRTRAFVAVQIAGLDDLGGGRGRLRLEWEVLHPVPEAYQPFIHFTSDAARRPEGIVFQGGTRSPRRSGGSRASSAARWTSLSRKTRRLPDGLGIRIGFYTRQHQHGPRLRMAGNADQGGRARCGTIRQARAAR